MRAHPISPVTEPMQYRAIGVVRGVYEPVDPDQPTRGAIRTAGGEAIEAVVLGRLLTLMRRHLDLAQPHLWVVYPRSREPEGLHLQMVGVWEPSTLASELAAEPDADALPEGDDYFSVRGELIYTRPPCGSCPAPMAAGRFRSSCSSKGRSRCSICAISWPSTCAVRVKPCSLRTSR